ncbi:MAG: type III pantothenate kinase [Planctomycetes bacterium]|nr:type III pantothenate kinase [Planctomycetota bacterium]
MNVSFLAISVGNTRTQIGAFVNGKLAERLLVPSDDMKAVGLTLETAAAALKDYPDAPAVLATVNPPASAKIIAEVKSRLGLRVLRVGKDTTIPIGKHLDPESIVGEDRLLNAAAAYDTLKQACVIVDAGTAITIDYVDGAGTFHGGAIGPGAKMMLRSMHQGAVQLPEVAFAPPQEAIGHNTVEAMRSAVYHGLRGMVRELTEQYAFATGAYPLVIATGGDAETLFADYDLIDRVVPDLTLIGMAVSLQASLDNEDGDGDEADDADDDEN